MPATSKVPLTKRLIEAAQPGQCLSDSEVRGLRLIVSPNGTKRFVASYRVGPKGKASMKALGPFGVVGLADARKAAAEVLRLARLGIDPAASRHAPTVADLAQLYLDDYALDRNLSNATVRHARALLAIATAHMGRRKAGEVTIADVRKLHGEVRRAGIERGSKGNYQANRLLAVLSKCFSLAIERGWRSDNPCKGVRKHDEDARWRNLSEGEVGRLLDACDAYEAGRRLRPGGEFVVGRKARLGEAEALPSLTISLPLSERSATDKEAADAIRLLLFTGARLQEVLKAEWGQFDLGRGVWEKPSAHTKTRRLHRLELEGPALALLREMGERAGRHPLYLFPGDPTRKRKGAPLDILTGRPKVSPRADLRHPWREICAIAGLEGVRLHDLRRTTASFMLSHGASLATVGKALGHTQPSTTARYATLAPSVQKAALGAAGDAMVAGRGATPHNPVLRLPGAASRA